MVEDSLHHFELLRGPPDCRPARPLARAVPAGLCASHCQPSSSRVDPSAERGWVGREEEEADI